MDRTRWVEPIEPLRYNPGMISVIRSDPQILGGTPCFAGTRVPVKSLFDHIEAGYTVEYFLAQFPTVKRDQVTALLQSVSRKAEDEALAAAKA